jgi:hypothetical protein
VAPVVNRFHFLSEFDDGKRSCRKRLADHHRRRRKPQPSALTCDAAVECIGMKGEEDSDLCGSPASDSKSMLLHPKNCGSLSLVSLDDSNEQPASAQNNLQLNTPAATFGRVPKEDQHSSQPGMQQTSSQPRGLERTIWRNFHDSETYSGALPPVSVEDLRVSSIAQFVKRRAVRALDDPAWKRTYEESYSQVM